ncbi:MAG: molecular chaperone DnaJ [Cyanobacteria bacterium SZAS LIN-3]|nr:molecular chaperone DnaJ [Cyanobacteria bacterium SZAS LIN-3]
MAKRDYYEVLGLSRGATGDEIKKSFRNRARQLHPDNKESGDEAAFKELAEAYEVLSDEQKKAAYDRYGHEGVKGSTRDFDNVDFSSFAGVNFEDILESLFGGGGRGFGGFGGGGGNPNAARQGAHLKYDLELEFLDAVFGVEKKITVRRLEDCTGCEGSGAAPGSATKTCATCNGQGQVRQVVNMLFMQTYQVIICPDCSGAGKKIEKPCKDCKGAGQVRKPKELDVKVPAGIENGTRLRLTQAGDKGTKGGPYGDLFVILHVKEHPTFIRDAQTIHIKQPIGFAMAALGGEILVPTVEGNKPLKVPAAIQSGSQLVMKGLGVPYLSVNSHKGSQRGDQIVHVIVETPSKLSAEEKKLFERLAELRNEKLSVPTAKEKEKDKEKDKDKDRDKASAEDKKDHSHVGTASSDKHKAAGKETNTGDSILDKIVDVFRPKGSEHTPD